MENNNFKPQGNIKKDDSFVEQQVPVSLSETNYNQSLTNEEKLEYLSKLIQNVEQNLESNTTSKKLAK